MKIKRIILATILVSFLAFPSLASAEKIGWITDIHAGSQSKRKQTNYNIVYPKKYKSYLSSALKKLTKAGISTVVFTGDNTNLGEKKYAKKLKSIVKEKRINPVWVKGNHDRDKYKTMAYLGAPSNYYYYDTAETRIIVLDNSDTSLNVYGQIDEVQFNWFQDVLENSSLPVIVASHISFVDWSINQILSQYNEIENVISVSGKVNFVISGDSHCEQSTMINNVKHLTAKPLTLKNNMGSYYIIDTDSLNITYSKL